MKPTKDKDYLGDAVYADFDGHHIVLTVEDGERAYERISLDPDVYAALVRYASRFIVLNKERK